MEAFGDFTAIIDKLNNVDGYQSFSSIGIGTCFTIRSLNLDENRVFINIKGRTTEESYSIPFVLKKIIASNLYKKICAKKLNPIIEYLGMVKHNKMGEREYHNFNIVKILPEDGEEVINSESTATTS